jgi:hypothetical protein
MEKKNFYITLSSFTLSCVTATVHAVIRLFREGGMLDEREKYAL